MTRYLIAVAALAVTFSGCTEKNTTPTTPTDLPPKFTSILLAINEVPPVTNADVNANGTMVMTFNLTKDAAGVITGGTVDFNGTMAGFPTGSSLTAAHIHTGASGVAGGVLVNTGIATGEIAFPSGSGALNKTGVTLTAAQATSILANPAGFYFNAHTSLNPSGAIRGQLQRTQ